VFSTFCILYLCLLRSDLKTCVRNEEKMNRDHNASRNVVIASEAPFVVKTWAVGLRPDQRTFLQLRDIVVDFPLDAQRNVCVVKLGQTIVSSSVGCELVEPSPMQPRHGFLEFHCTTNITDGGSGLATHLKRGSIRQRNPLCEQVIKRLDAMIKVGRALDTESLCVVPGRNVWSVRVDVSVLNDEGNAEDVAVWAAMASLLNTRRPEVSVRGETVLVHPPHERDPIPLSIHHVPLPITNVVTPKTTTASSSSLLASSLHGFVVDPTLAEVSAASAVVTVALNAEDQVCNVLKEGGGDVSYGLVKSMVAHAKSLYPQIRSVMDDAMALHEKKRKDAVRAQFQWAQTRTGVGKAAPAVAVGTTPESSEQAADEPDQKKRRTD
jgi:exosome complex component RRP45